MSDVPTTTTTVPTNKTDFSSTSAVSTTATPDPAKTAVPVMTDVLLPVQVNIALNKKTEHVGTWYDGLSEYAVDGNRETTLVINDIYQCQHTIAANKPWWYVDFGSIKKVRTVKVLNRGDCCGDRLKFLLGYVSSDKGNPLDSNDKQLCFTYAGPAATGEELTFTCPSGLAGRYFSILMDTSGYLTMCEVEVYET
jgi:hypothetical protein